MLSFAHGFLLFGLTAVAVPVLIHLINMLRHRRVEWAAMEFLLVSQRKHRTWIILKQLLLLLLRMLAIAAVVFMVAQPLLRQQWAAVLGQTKTHHIILLDDSFSMADHWGDTTAFDQAKAVINRIGAAAAKETQPQSFTLLRFSRVGRVGSGADPDLKDKRVDSQFAAKLAALLKDIDVSQTAAEPAPALQALDKLLDDPKGERRILYLISDFRARQWDEPTELKRLLSAHDKAGVQLHLIDCVDATRPNLAVTALEPAEGIRAAGVPWFMEVSVHNFGTAPAKDVPVLLTQDGQGRTATTLAEIPPDRTVKGRFPVFFATGGEHQVLARLEGDALDVDNSRYAVVDVPAELSALLVDGDPAAADARYLSVALAPGGQVRTGIRPRIETPQYLSLKSLAEYQSITLANIDRLDRSAVEALERYARAGGGVAFFLGPQTDARFINEALYREGEGLFPLPLGGPVDLGEDYRLEKTPDVEVDARNFMFRVFAEKRNTFLNTVLVERYFPVRPGWRQAPGAATRILARLRNEAPLVVERTFGKGRVVAVLSSAAPTWNNWARNPSFVVAMQDLQAYLGGRPAAAGTRRIGQPLELTRSVADYQSQVRFNTPAKQNSLLSITGSNEGPQWRAVLRDTGHSGFYEAQLTRNNGKIETCHFAVNVDAEEGDLRALFGPELAARLKDVKYQFAQVGAFELPQARAREFNLGEAMLYLLALLLVAEQIVAWWASYHPPVAAKPVPARPKAWQTQGGAV